MKLSYRLLTLLPLFLTSACKTTGDANKSGIKATVDSKAEQALLLDVNDVSILFPKPSEKDESGYIRLSDLSKEGPILSEDLFKQSFNLLGEFSNKAEYADFAVVGIRIDNCAKLVPQQPCTPQLRLVVQPLVWVALAEGGRARLFDDEALHLAFNVAEADKEALYRDFLNLKKSALPKSSQGALGVHPVLEAEGINGAFSKRLKELVLKYSLVSKYERVAVMNLTAAGPGGNWSFAASLPIKNGQIIATPIPCQTEKLNAFVVMNIGGELQMNVFPDSTCGDLEATEVIKGSTKTLLTLPLKDKEKAVANALRINDPSKVFFGQTTCTNCHLASRRMTAVMGEEYLNAKDGNPLRFQVPSDVSSDSKHVSDDNGNWGIRAFGWGETGSRIGITLYTLNDSMRVAHEINDLIRAGTLKP